MTIIEQIKAEIERRKSLLTQHSKLTYDLILETFIKEYDDLLSFLSSLESEKPMNQEGLEEEISKSIENLEGCTTKVGGAPEYHLINDEELREFACHFAQWGAEHLANVSKTSPKDLEEAAGEYAEEHGFRVPYDGSDNFYDDVDVKASKEGFIAGAKWQVEQLLKSSPLPEDTVLFNKGVEEGKRLMMEEAVEVPIYYTHEVSLPPEHPGFGKVGDKVKIIIVRED